MNRMGGIFTQRVDEGCADVCGEWFSITHHIAGVGIDHVEGGLLVGGLGQVSFDDADILHREFGVS